MAGFDLEQLMQQAQAIQAQMQRAQAELATKEVQGTAGGGMVIVTANGLGELQSVKIDPAVVSKDDVPLLEDLVRAAANQALTAARAMMQQGTMAGMPDLSGMFPGGIPR